MIPVLLGEQQLSKLVAAVALPGHRKVGKEREHLAAAEFHGGARLAVDKDLIDFGAVKLGQRVHASFQLRNIGDRVLLLPSAPPVDVVEGC